MTGLVLLLKLDSNGQFFSPCDLEISWMTLNKANLRDLIAATGLVMLLKLDWNHWFFQPCVTLKFHGWPRKIIGQLFYTTLSFVNHFKFIGELKTRVTVRKRSIPVKIGDFLSRMTLKFDRWPWTRQIWGILKLRLAYSPETCNLGQNRWCFVLCDLEIWWMTLENNRASLLCCFKHCATFHSHWWIQTGVTVRKGPIWVKFDDF